jgi:hypothetical protein
MSIAENGIWHLPKHAEVGAMKFIKNIQVLDVPIKEGVQFVSFGPHEIGNYVGAVNVNRWNGVFGKMATIPG